MRVQLLRRGALAGVVGLALAGAMPAGAAEPSNAELLERIERLEKKNEDLEKALEGSRLSETEPELATRLKAVEFQTLSMQKQARTIEALEGITAGLSFTTVMQGANNAATTDRSGESSLNYRADVFVTLPAGNIGTAEGKIFGQFRMGQGHGLTTLNPTYSGPNTAAFQLNGVSQPSDSAALLAQAWYQLNMPVGSVSPGAPARESAAFNFGKMDPFLFFDQNAAANDETRQFLNNVFVHNPLLDAGRDIGTDDYGFAPGMRLAYVNETQKPLAYGLSAGIFGAGQGAHFNDRTLGSPLVILQADTHQKFFGGLDGNYRVYVWRNGQATPYHNQFDPNTEVHSGWGISLDQRVGDAVTLFGRYGREAQGRVQFDRALTAGAEWGGTYWDRAADTLGLALGWLRTSAEFRADAPTLDANNDGTPDFGYPAEGTETVAELYYRYRFNRQFDLSPDLQLIRHPGGNPDAAAMHLIGLRAQLTF